MRGKDLLECMEHIDDALVEEALEPAAFPHRHNSIVRWGMAAACVVVVGVSVTAFWSHRNIGVEHTESAGKDTASSSSMDTVAGDGGIAQGIPENTRTGSDNTGGAQTGGMADDEGAVSSGTSADKEEAAVQGAAKEADPNSDNAAAVTESEDKLLTEEVADEETKKLSYTVISDYYGEKDGSIYDYKVPEKGEFFCYHDLQETMEYYAEQEMAARDTDSPIYAYDVVIDLYGNIEIDRSNGMNYVDLSEHISAGSEQIEQEYRRLSELGYAVRLSEDFQLTGTFTKVELDTFQASPEYGYTFRFADEH